MAEWDAVVVGGGAAGLAAALTLVRARRRTLVVDAGEPRNRFAAHSHGVLGFDGDAPGVLLERGRADLARYGVVPVRGTATAARRTPEGFALTVDGEDHATRALVVATGVTDQLPDVPGLAEQWGTGVVVCPYCDGWEHRDLRIGVLAVGDRSVGQALLVRQWSAATVLLTAGVVRPTAGEEAALDARGIDVVDGSVDSIAAEDGRLTGVVVAGRLLPFDVVFTSPRPVPNDAVIAGLGADRHDGAAGSFVRANAEGATSVPGLWVAGNAERPSLKVQTAAGAGMAAGADANEWLMREDVIAALRGTGVGSSLRA